MSAPDLLSDCLVAGRSELVCLIDALDAWDLESIARTGRRLVRSGEDCGLPVISEIGMSLESAPNLDAAMYAMEKLRCCLSILDDTGWHVGPGASASGECIETQVIRELLPEFIASTLEKIRVMVLAL